MKTSNYLAKCVSLSITVMITASFLPAKADEPEKAVSKETVEYNVDYIDDFAAYAPIRYPFIVGWYATGWEPPRQSDYLNMLTATYDNHETWAERGVLPLYQRGWHYVNEERISNRVKRGRTGFVADELLKTDEDDPHNRERFQAMREVKKEHPEIYFGVHGNTITPSMVEAIEDGTLDHFYDECYTYSTYDNPGNGVSPEGIRQRMKMHRAAGTIDRVVWHFGLIELDPDSYYHKGFTPTRLEYEMQLAREWAPEIAGVCFYNWRMRTRDSSDALAMYEAQDRLVYEYFIRPAPEVALEIEPNKENGADIRVSAGKSEFGGETVKTKIFVGTEQVATDDQYRWDCSDLDDGEYLVTAHARTEDHYRGAAQKAVTVRDGRIIEFEKRPDERPEYEPMERLKPAGGGEPTRALAVNDRIVYLGVGESLRVLEYSEKWRIVPAGEDVPSLKLPGRPESFTVEGSTLYAACGQDGLAVIDIDDPENPEILTVYDKLASAEQAVPVATTLLLVAAGTDGLVVLDTGDRTAPTRIGGYPLDCASGVAFAEGVAYVAAGLEGLVLLDVTGNPTSPQLLARQETGNWALRVAVSDGVAAVADWKGGIRVVDVSEPNSPEEMGRHLQPWVWDVAIRGNMIYFADENFGLRAFDYTDPETISDEGGRWSRGSTVIWDRKEPGDALNVALAGDRVFFLDGWLGLRSFSIADGPKEQRRDGVLYPIKSVWNVWLKGVRPYN